MGLALAACGGGGGGETGNSVVSANPSGVMGAGATNAGSSTGATIAPTTTSTTGTGSTNTAGVDPATSAVTPSGGMTDGPVNTGRVSVSGLSGGTTPAAARLKNGGYVISWASGGKGVCTRTYAANATPAGAESCIDGSNSSSSTFKPAVTGLAGGGYVVAYVRDEFQPSGVLTQRFTDSGAKVGTGQIVDTGSSKRNTAPTVAALDGGDYVVGWTSAENLQQSAISDIYARRYSPDGVAVSPARRVNTHVGTTSSRPSSSAAAALRDGGYVFVWTSERQNENGAALSSQRFDADGVPAGIETLANDNLANPDNEYSPSVAGLAGGGYVISFTSNLNVITQRFAADGSRVGPAAAVNAQAPILPGECDRGPRFSPGPCPVFQRGALAALDDGGYVIAYASTDRPTYYEADIYARRFGADGLPSAPSQLIMDYASEPTASPTGNGGFVIAGSTTGRNTPPPGIFSRTFDSRGF